MKQEALSKLELKEVLIISGYFLPNIRIIFIHEESHNG
jgi:hypothetical protein